MSTLGFAPLGGAPYGAPYDFGGEPLLDVIVEEGIRVSRTVTPSAKWGRTVSDTVQLLNPTPIFGYNFPITVFDGVLTFDSAAGFKGYFRTITDAVRMSDVVEVTRFLSMILADGVRFSNTTAISRGVSAIAVAGIGMHDQLDVIYGLLVVERLRIADPHIINWIANCDAADLVSIAETLRQTLPVDMVEGLGISMDQLVQTAIRVLERVRIGDAARGQAIYHVTVTQALRLRESLGNFFGAEIEEAVGFADVLAARALAFATVAEQLGVHAGLTPQLLLSVKVADTVGIDDADVVNMLYNPLLREGVVLEAGYVAPDGSFTTWVMNTRTAAITEYHDFAFNSFARMGNLYLGASADGLFELLGDDDEGEDIVARIKGGFMQFGGTQLSRLKAAYISARGEGEMWLKIIEGDGKVYVYKTDTRNMRSTKVHMGKGQRSRYFAFELVTDGQDFDLDTIEFVPLVVQRRV